MLPSGTILVPRVDGNNNFKEEALDASDIPINVSGSEFVQLGISGLNLQDSASQTAQAIISLRSDLSLKVSLTGTETVSGVKTFVNQLITPSGILTSDISSSGTDPITLNPRSDSNRKFTFSAPSDTSHTLTFGDGGTTSGQSLLISASTSDGDDDARVSIAGGGTNLNARGAFLDLYGNEAIGGFAGFAQLSTGSGSSADLYLTAAGASNSIFLRAGGAVNRWQVSSDAILGQQTANAITAGTSNASDVAYLLLGGGGGGSSTGSSRGAHAFLYGNEAASFGGNAYLITGDTSGSSLILRSAATSGTIQFQKVSGSTIWSMNQTGQLVQDGTNGSDLIFNVTNGIIRQGTVDGSDSGSMKISSGGASTDSRGAFLELYGNENGFTGGAILSAGNVSGGDIYFNAGGGTSFQLKGNSNSEIVFNRVAAAITSSTSDGADNALLYLAGGGGRISTGSSRGAFISLAGNEHAQTGILTLNAGNVSGGVININTGGSIRWTLPVAGHLTPGANNSYDLGSSSVMARTLYVGTSIIGTSTSGSSLTITTNTVSGTDNASLFLGGGGGTLSTRGADVLLYGRDHVKHPGKLQLFGASGGSGGKIEITVFNAQPIEFKTQNSLRWSMDSDGHLITGSDNSYNIGTSGTRVSRVYTKNISISDTPVNGTDGANKSYADGKVSRAGDSISGSLTFVGDYDLYPQSSGVGRVGRPLQPFAQGFFDDIYLFDSTDNDPALAVNKGYVGTISGNLQSQITSISGNAGVTLSGAQTISGAKTFVNTLTASSGVITNFITGVIGSGLTLSGGSSTYNPTITINDSGITLDPLPDVPGRAWVINTLDGMHYGAVGIISASTSDGSDNNSLNLVGGGYSSGDTIANRGASIQLLGNEAAGLPGGIGLATGAVSGAHLDLKSYDSARIYTGSSNTLRWVIDAAAGHITSQAYGTALKLLSGNSRFNVHAYYNYLGTSEDGGYLAQNWNFASGTSDNASFSTAAIALNNRTTSSEIRFMTGTVANTAPTQRWVIDSSSFVPAANNTYDIGTTGNRVKTIYSVNALNTSDLRIKEDISAIDASIALDILSRVNPVTYKLKSTYDNSGRDRAGFLAQELISEIPEAVFAGDSDLEKQYGDEGFECWSLDTSHILPYAIAAIKELKVKLEAAEARLTELENG